MHDTFALAFAFLLLHEFGHIHAQSKSLEPKEEELFCDRFAAGYLLDRHSEYGQRDEQARVAKKRAIGISIGLNIICWLQGNRVSVSHPPVRERAQAVFGRVDLASIDSLWDFVSAAAVGRILSEGRSDIEVTSTNRRELALELFGMTALFDPLSNPQP